MAEKKITRVLFVCLGNICRSPMAEAVFRQLVQEAGLSDHFEIQSAGTGAWHVGERPHHGTLDVLRRNRIAVGNQRAQQLNREHMDIFDYIIAMDAENVADIKTMFGKQVRRLLDYAPSAAHRDVPDPYYTGGFDTVYELVRAGADGLLQHIRKEQGL